MTTTSIAGTFRLPGEGVTTSLFGDSYTVKAGAEDSGGLLAVIEARMAPYSSGTPLHVNTLEDESYYVLEGSLTFQLDERIIEAPAGSYVHIPRGVVHTHWNAGAEPVKVLGFPTPSGFESFFADLAALLAQTPGGPPDISQVAALYTRYGLQVVGPPPQVER